MIEPLPRIKPEDYDTVRALSVDLPDTYAEWLCVIEEYARELLQLGHAVEWVEVSPSDFVLFCGSIGGHGSRQELLRFVGHSDRVSPKL